MPDDRDLPDCFPDPSITLNDYTAWVCVLCGAVVVDTGFRRDPDAFVTHRRWHQAHS